MEASPGDMPSAVMENLIDESPVSEWQTSESLLDNEKIAVWLRHHSTSGAPGSSQLAAENLCVSMAARFPEMITAYIRDSLVGMVPQKEKQTGSNLQDELLYYKKVEALCACMQAVASSLGGSCLMGGEANPTHDQWIAQEFFVPLMQILILPPAAVFTSQAQTEWKELAARKILASYRSWQLIGTLLPYMSQLGGFIVIGLLANIGEESTPKEQHIATTRIRDTLDRCSYFTNWIELAEDERTVAVATLLFLDGFAALIVSILEWFATADEKTNQYRGALSEYSWGQILASFLRSLRFCTASRWVPESTMETVVTAIRLVLQHEPRSLRGVADLADKNTPSTPTETCCAYSALRYLLPGLSSQGGVLGEGKQHLAISFLTAVTAVIKAEGSRAPKLHLPLAAECSARELAGLLADVFVSPQLVTHGWQLLYVVSCSMRPGTPATSIYADMLTAVVKGETDLPEDKQACLMTAVTEELPVILRTIENLMRVAEKKEHVMPFLCILEKCVTIVEITISEPKEYADVYLLWRVAATGVVAAMRTEMAEVLPDGVSLLRRAIDIFVQSIRLLRPLLQRSMHALGGDSSSVEEDGPSVLWETDLSDFSAGVMSQFLTEEDVFILQVKPRPIIWFLYLLSYILGFLPVVDNFYRLFKLEIIEKLLDGSTDVIEAALLRHFKDLHTWRTSFDSPQAHKSDCRQVFLLSCILKAGDILLDTTLDKRLFCRYRRPDKKEFYDTLARQLLVDFIRPLPLMKDLCTNRREALIKEQEKSKDGLLRDFLLRREEEAVLSHEICRWVEWRFKL